MEATSDEKTPCVEVEATPETMAKVHPMNTSESIARAMTVTKTIDLVETALPFRGLLERPVSPEERRQDGYQS